MRATWRWFRLRGLALVVVFGCGLTGFLLGSGVSERPSVVDSPLAVKVYYTLGLFVLGGLDIGTPVGGPALGRALLWFSYIAAPGITISAVVEAAIRAITQERWWLARLREHVVIGGAGRLGMLLLARTRQLSRDVEIVVVDAHADNPNLEAIHDVYGARVLIGDISSDAVIDRLHLERASRLALLTGEDLINLDAASKMLKAHPSLAGRVVVHVSDLGFLRSLAQTRLGQEVEAFNSHQVAASYLVRTTLAKHFAATPDTDCVVLAGFGRFGQSLLNELATAAAGRFDTVVVLDIEAERRWADYKDAVGEPEGCRTLRITGNLEDPLAWRDALAEIRGRKPVVVLGTTDDRANLRAALHVGRNLPGSMVIARTFDVSSVGNVLAEDGGFECFAVSDLVAASIPERWCTARSSRGDAVQG